MRRGAIRRTRWNKYILILFLIGCISLLRVIIQTSNLYYNDNILTSIIYDHNDDDITHYNTIFDAADDKKEEDIKSYNRTTSGGSNDSNNDILRSNDVKSRNGETSTNFQNAIQCRQQVEKQNEHLYKSWLVDQVPILHYATIANNQLHVVFITSHLQSLQGKFESNDWFGSGKDINNNNYDDNRLKSNKALKVSRSRRSGYIVVSFPYVYGSLDIIYSTVPSNTTGHIVKYDISTLLQCDQLEEDEFFNSMTSTFLSSSSSTSMKIGACTMIQGTESRQQVLQWVEFHRMIGIDHFWVFINEPFSYEYLPQNLPYVKYVPFNFDIKPYYNYTSYRHVFTFIQVPMQVQCLQMMKKYKFDWFVTTDVDEYIFVTKNVKYGYTEFNSTIESIDELKNDVEPDLKYLVNSISDRDDYGGFELNSIPFGRHMQLEPKDKDHELLIDYIWRDKEDPWTVPFRRYKVIYNSRLAEDIGVHYLWRGGKKGRLDVKTQARLNHYKNPNDGVYDVFRQSHRLKNDTSLVYRYRTKLVKILAESVKSAVVNE